MKERITLKKLKKVLSQNEMKNVLGGSNSDWCTCPDGEAIWGLPCTSPSCGTLSGYGGCKCP